MNNEIKRIIIDESHYTEVGYPFTIKPNFSTLGSSIMEISTQGPVITFVPDDSIGDLLGFNKTTIYENMTFHLIRLIYYHSIIYSLKLILPKD